MRWPAAPVTCRLAALGLNDTYQVEAGDATRFRRVYRHGSHARASIDAEVALLNELSAAGMPVAVAVARADGEFVSALGAAEGTRYAMLFTAAPGAAVRDITPSQARAYGRLAAQLHNAWDARTQSLGRPLLEEQYLIDRPLAAVQARFGEHEEVRYLVEVAGHVRAALTRLPRQAPEFGLCHGDLHSGNVRFGLDDVPTLFDFDLTGYGWRSYDLSVFLWSSYLENRPRRWRDARWRAFMRGYGRLRPLPSDLVETLPFFLVARQIWLLGLDCAGRSDQLPQQVNERALRLMVGFVRRWEVEYPALTR